MSNTKKTDAKTPEAVELVKTTSAVEVIDKPKTGKLEKGSQEAKDKMAEVRECVTPESYVKGAETKQKTAAMRHALQLACNMKYEGAPIGNVATQIWNKFHNNGIGSYYDAMALAVITKATDGDVDAFKVVRDTLGEKPVEETNHSGNITVTLAPTIPKDWME